MKKLYYFLVPLFFIGCLATIGVGYALEVDNAVMELPLDIVEDNFSPDISGEGNDVELKNGASLVFGRAGHGLHISGTDDEHGLIAEAEELNLQNEITIAFWIKTDEDRISWTGTRQREIVFRKGSNINVGFEQEDEDDVCLRMFVRFSLNPDRSQSAEIHERDCNLRDNEWHHVVASFKKNGYFKLIVDGDLSGDCNDTEEVRQENQGYGIRLSGVDNSYVLGARVKSNGTVDRELRCILDHVYIFDKQLSDAEASKLYHGDDPS